MNSAAATAPQITFPIQAQVGAITIAVHRIPGGYSILTTSLGTNHHDWCGHFTSLKQACGEASRILDLFNTHGGPGGVENHANMLRIRLASETSRSTCMQDTVAIANLYTELAALEALGARRVRAALRNQFTNAA